MALLADGEAGCVRDTDCAGWEAGMRCAAGVCAAGRVLGEACATDDDCELPLVCDRARLVCAKPWADLGEACAAGPCLLSFQCDRTTAAATATAPVCVRRARHREQCDAAAGCEYPYTCAGYCTDLRHARALGDSCASTVDCAEGLLCLPSSPSSSSFSSAGAGGATQGRVCQTPEAACGAGRVLPRCSMGAGARDVCVLPHAPANATVAQHAEDLMLCIDANAFHWSNCAAPFARLLAALGGRARWQPCVPWATVPVPAPPSTVPSSDAVPTSAPAATARVAAAALAVVLARALTAATGPA